MKLRSGCGFATAVSTVTTSDEGKPFNPLARAAPDTSLPLQDRKVGGIGIHLARSMTDDIRYEHHTDQNTLTLIIAVDVPNERS